jgi:uncharacterized membrane protein
MNQRLIPDDRVRTALWTLLFSSGLSLALLAGRAIFAGHLQLSFYVWNLILAWLPLVFALRVYQIESGAVFRWWPFALWAGLWFFFFPNAPYIVTDFLHLKSRPPVPKWFDLVMMMAFAWLGLLLGYFSLFLMQEVVRRRVNAAWSWGFATGMLALGSFGIYLGRFERWNSWDVIARPLGLAGDVVKGFDFQGNPQLFAFLLTFFVFSIITYAPLYALTHLREAAPAPAPES